MSLYWTGLLIGLLGGGTVTVVLGYILTVFMISNVVNAHANAMIHLSGLMLAIDMFQYDTGRPPTPTEGLAILKQYQPRGPYLREIPVDPWGRAYVYRIAPDGTPLVGTFGRDGLPGGTGQDTDLEMLVKLRMPLSSAFTNSGPPATQPIPPIVPRNPP